ncbi:MAG: hypothetical protein ABIX01_05020 [Chitinophagaceae bacterium]
MNNKLYEHANGSQAARFLFYFVFVYVALYIFPFPLDLVVSILQRFFSWMNELTGWAFLKSINSGIDAIFGWWTDLWHWLIPAAAKHIFHFKNPITIFPGGSGDTTFNWVETMVKMELAVAGATIWQLAGKKKDYTRLHHFLLMMMRYFLAYMMISYGFIKIIQTQFPYPGLGRLVQPYGESSPMGLAWTFMGYSTGYNFFTGSCEVLGGFLLCFRRTQTFGALFSMTVCVNIFAMNMCFDIPVKLFSAHLVFFATYIAAGDVSRLFTFFFTNKPASTRENTFYFANSNRRQQWTWLKWIVLLFILYTNYADTKKGYYEYGMGKPKQPLYGIYNAEYKIVNNDTIPLIYKDTTNWKQLILSSKGYARVKLLNDSLRWYVFNVDTLKHSIGLYPEEDTVAKYQMSYTVNKDLLTIAGRMKTDSVVMQFRRYDETKFLLNSRGFHWVNEDPYNK